MFNEYIASSILTSFAKKSKTDKQKTGIVFNKSHITKKDLYETVDQLVKEGKIQASITQKDNLFIINNDSID